jgi:hypothetical protein
MDPMLKLLRQEPRAGWEWTLNPTIGGWNRGNALALANCALLAYSDADRVRHERIEALPA